jgi:isoleucyl-tRNA synthetase
MLSQNDYAGWGRPVPVFADPKDPRFVYLATGDPYNKAVHDLMIRDDVNAWWNRDIKYWRIRRHRYQLVKEELADQGFDCPDEPPAAAAGGA